MRLFHVTSSLNRASISEYGLDWQRMGVAPGIAGSRRPEAEGVFLCRDEFEVDWFVRMNNTGGSVDVWSVEDVDRSDLVDNGNGHGYLPRTIAAEQLKLVRSGIPALEAHYR